MTPIRILAIVLIVFTSCGNEKKSEAPQNGGPVAQQEAPASAAQIEMPAEFVIPEFTAANFEKSVEAGSYSFLEFGGKSCKPCRQMQTILRELKSRYPSLTIGNIYMENSRDLLEKWKIQLIPTQVLLGPDKKEIMRHVGLWEMKDILAAFKKHHVAL